MKSIADMVERMLSAGCPPDSIVVEVRVAEADALKAMQKRRNWDKERQRRKRAADKESGGLAPAPISFLTKDSDSKIRKESKRSLMNESSPDLFGNVPTPADDWPEDFADQFWNKWPRHQRKYDRKTMAARLARVRAKREATWAEVWGGLCAYLATDPEPKFIPAPAVWVQKARWLADYNVVMTARPKTSPMLDYAREQLRNADQSDDAAGSSEIARRGNSG